MRFKVGEPMPLIWRGTSKSDYMAFPVTVQREMGYALFLAQAGKRHATMAKTLKGFGGGTVIEVKESYGGKKQNLLGLPPVAATGGDRGRRRCDHPRVLCRPKRIAGADPP